MKMKEFKGAEKIAYYIAEFFNKKQNIDNTIPEGFSKAFYSDGNSVGLVDKNFGLDEFEKESKAFCEEYIRNHKK